MTFSPRVKYILGAVTLVLAMLVGAVHYTSFCDLQAVTLDGRTVDNFDRRFGLHSERSVVRQPLDSIARALLHDKDVRRVDIRFAIPNGLEIITNSFTPTSFVLSEKTGKLYGLDRQARVVAIPDHWDDWERPVLVNARVDDMFEPCRDVRVPIVLDDLQRLRDEHADLYRVITEVDFAQPDFLVVSLAGLESRLWVNAADVYVQLERFVRFVHNFTPDLDSTRIIDLRFDNQIVCSVKGR